MSGDIRKTKDNYCLVLNRTLFFSSLFCVFHFNWQQIEITICLVFATTKIKYPLKSDNKFVRDSDCDVCILLVHLLIWYIIFVSGYNSDGGNADSFI